MPVLHDDDLITVHDVRDALRNDDGCTVAAGLDQGILNLSVGFLIHSTGSVIHDQNIRIGDDGAGKIQTLPLTARKVFPSFFDGGIIISLEEYIL